MTEIDVLQKKINKLQKTLVQNKAEYNNKLKKILKHTEIIRLETNEGYELSQHVIWNACEAINSIVYDNT